MKIITNNNETQNITVQTKFVSGPNNGIDISLSGSMDRNYAFSKNIYTVMKITFNNLLDGEKITGGVVNLASEEFLDKTTFRMVQINSVDLNNNSTLLNSIHTLVSNGNLGKIYVEESTITKIMVGENARLIHSIDISKVIKGMNKDNNVIYLCLFNDAESTNTFLCGPEANNGASITAYVETNIGHASYKSYKEYPLSFTKGLVNINNGELTQFISLYSGIGKKAPINLSFVLRDNIESSYISIGNSFADFDYVTTFDNREVCAILTDASGYEKTFINLDTTAYNFSYKDYNIKHSDTHSGFTKLYFCQQDGSYFYLFSNSIFMYDKNDICYKYEYADSIWKLVEIKDVDNNTLTYNWDSAKVTSIVSSDGDTLVFTYTNNKINQISSSISNMYISFIYGTNTLTIKKERYNNPTNLTGLEEIEKLQLTFSSNKLINVKDLKTGDEVTYSRTNGIIDKVYSKNGTKYYCYDSFVYYDNNHTKLTDYTGKYLCYYFDIHGRVQFIIDQNGNCIDNMMEDKYEQLNHRVNHNIVQSKNYLENGDFESTTGWTFTNTTQGSVDCNSDGISGKCLRVNKGTAVPVIKDYVYSVPEGNYYLCGYIKRPANATTTQVILKGTSTIGGSSTVSNKATLDFKLNEEWEYFETDKIEITSSLNNIEITINLITGAGDYYFDNFRLLNAKHKGSNYVQNGYFDYLTNNGPLGWTFTNFTYQETTAAQHDHPLLLGTRVLKIPFNNDLGVTKRASYLIDKKGYKNEELELSVMSKCFEINQLKYRSFIKMEYDNMSPITYYFDFKKGIEHWHAISNSIITADSYSSIEIGVEYDGEHEPLFDAFQLKEKKDVLSYMYTSNGRINQISNGSSSQQLIYDSNNQLIKSFGSDGIVSTYTYDNKNKINVIKDSLGNTITYTYDDEGKFLESISHTNSDGTITKTYVHDDNGNQTSITEEGVGTNLTYDDYSRVKTSKYGEYITYNYDYYTNDLLKNVYTTPSTLVNTIVYDIWKEVSSFSNAHGTYSFTHNLNTNIYTISINGTTFATYQYEIKSVVIDNTTCTFLTNKLEQVTFNNGDVYQYVYDCEENLVEIKINNTTLAKYNYDTNGNISFESKEGQITRYIYDDDARLKKTYVNSDKIENVYQNDRITQQRYRLGNQNRVISYAYPDEAQELTQEGFIGRLINKYQDEVIILSDKESVGVFGTKIDNEICSFHNDPSFNLSYCKLSTYEESVTIDLDKVHPSGSNDEWKNKFLDNQTFIAFLKFNHSISNGNIFSFYKDNTLKYKLNFRFGGGIELVNALGVTLATNQTTFISSGVNAVGIKFEKDSNKVILLVNSETVTSVISDDEDFEFNKLIISQTPVPSGISEETSLPTPFNLFLLSLGSYDYLPSELENIFIDGRDQYFIRNDPKHISSTTYYSYSDLLDEYEIVDFTSTFETSKNVKPYDFEYHDGSYKSEKLRSCFLKDDKLVYGSFNDTYKSTLIPNNKSCLGYKFDDNGTGKIVVRFKLENSINCNNRTIISFSNTSYTELMYVDAKSNGYLDVVVNGNVVETFNNNFNDNNWHTLFIDYNDHYIITVIDAEREVVVDNPSSFNGVKAYIGCSKVRNTKLNGYISLLAHSDTSVETSSGALDVAEIFETYSQPVEIINEYDLFGRKVLKRIKSANYESRDSINYKSNSYLPIYEEYNNGSIINYSYDTSNRLTNYDNEIQNTSYTYDSLGRLTKEVDTEQGTIDYTYDNNGNIKSKVKLGKYNMSFDYDDSVYKDRLTKVTDTVNNITTNFEYNGRLGYPTKIGNNTLTWEGKNLKTYGSNTYYYNANGFRYKKVTSQGTFNYILDGDRIIRMNKDNSIIFDFTYDVNGELVGLTYNGKQYFYMRDSFGNILGIIDKTGDIIVSYVYDAYGNTLREIVGSSTDSNASTIRTYNPFRYKGYCYDVETQLFYCNSRYYSPELCRWISPDSIEYLDPQIINGLNLYAYAKNNPIMYYDPSGHSAILVIGLLVGSFIVGAGASVVSQGLTYGWDEINYWQAGVDGLFALGSTALAMTGIGALASAGIGAVAGWSQYAIGSAFHGEDLTLLGSITSVCLGFIGGAISGAGARNGSNIASNMRLTGKGASAVKAITTASNRYLAREISMKGLQATTRLWGNVALNAVQDAIAPTIRHLMIKGALTIAGVTIGTAAVNCGLYYAY